MLSQGVGERLYDNKKILKPSLPQKLKARSEMNNISNKVKEMYLTNEMDEILAALEDAISFLDSLNIDNWGNPEDEGGILSGLQSSN